MKIRVRQLLDIEFKWEKEPGYWESFKVKEMDIDYAISMATDEYHVRQQSSIRQGDYSWTYNGTEFWENEEACKDALKGWSTAMEQLASQLVKMGLII